MTAPRVEIDVDRLIFHGLPPEEARHAAASFEARLTTLAARPTETVASRAEAFCAAPAVSMPARTPSAGGEAAAVAVWGAVSGGTQR